MLLVLGSACQPSAPDVGPAPRFEGQSIDPDVARLIDGLIEEIEADPASATARGRLGLAYDAGGLYRTALAAFEQATVLDPGGARWHYGRARMQAHLGDLDGALASVATARSLDGSYAPACWREGEWLLDVGRPEDAERSFRAALEKEPGALAARVGLARVHLQRGDDAAAIEILEGILENDPGEPFVYQLLGTALRRSGNARLAEEAFARAATPREPRWPDPWRDESAEFRVGFAADLERANVLVSGPDVEEGILLLERHVPLHPTNVALLTSLGTAYCRVGRFEEGINALEAALSHRPGHYGALLNLSKAYEATNRLEDALRVAELAVEAHPELVHVHVTEGLLLRNLGRHDEALAAFREARRVDARSVASLFWYGATLCDLGPVGRSRRCLRLHSRGESPGRRNLGLAGARPGRGGRRRARARGARSRGEVHAAGRAAPASAGPPGGDRVTSRRTGWLGLALAATMAACGKTEEAAPPPGPVTTAGSATTGASAWFEDVATSAGVEFVCESGHQEKCWFPEIMIGGCALLDVDGDEDLDLYLVQGEVPRDDDGRGVAGNRLYLNEGDFSFRDVSQGTPTDALYGMGVTTGDWDGDGDVDLYVTNVGPNTLLRNDGGGKLTDVTEASGTGHPGWAVSAAFLDYDRDGDLDLWAVNYVNWSPEGELDCYNDLGTLDYCLPTNYAAPASDVLYRNDGNGRFTDVSTAAGLRGSFGNGLGLTTVDFDDDGWVDVFVANDTTMDQLWINQGDGTFVDEGLVRGCALDEHGKAKAGMGVAVGDADRDGDPDLLVVNLGLETDSFFFNEGGEFYDRTGTVGLSAPSFPFTRFGVGLVDFDNDGVLDLYQANGRVVRSAESLVDDPYAEPNLLLRGVDGARFEKVEPTGGTAELLVHTSRGAAFGDLDGDGGVDAVVVNRDGPAYVLRNVVRDRGRWIAFRAVEGGRDALGAVITAEVDGRTVRGEILAASSYATANDPRWHLGLGATDTVRNVRVRWVDGEEEVFGDFEVGRTVTLHRGRGG